ncbi:sugar phosphate isomerase/epimerase family protein [Sphingobium sp. EP60837]|uniref:sugar phosphate isomerase/epimerase family protein n=1 Tax=Sphingobium sp. EP60837 TaxID=1855519 RepID=UPI0007DD60AB|nr:sugar phosphate isomerase/epimerase [Sphingobium sp. EP60837]ANI80166.1 hypothetical protein EP837_03786 [Sphingobium sp. EP60837]
MFSLCPLTVLPCSPLEQIDAAIQANYDAIGLRVTATLATDPDIMADAPLRATIAQRLSETGIKVLDVEVVRISPETDVDAWEPLLCYAGEIGARSIAITGEPHGDWTPGYLEATARNLGRLCDLAAQYGPSPSLEFMKYRSIGTLRAALEMVKRVERPNLTICVDALHFHRSGGTPDELARVDPSLISCFQVCDAPAAAPDDLPREARFGRLLPGKGGLPLEDMLSALPREIPIGVEVPDITRAGLPILVRAQQAAEATRGIIDAVRR